MYRAAVMAATSLAFMGIPTRLLAQSAPTPGNGTSLEEVVVTAQKRTERIAKVPLSVQAISGKDLQRAGITSATDLVRVIPTASIVSSISPGFETIEIRGISSGTTGDSLVGYYLDDTPFGIPNLQLSPPSRLLDVQRVEVIRGPSGTIYGQGSAGGTVKIVANKPNLDQVSGSIATEFSETQGGKANYETDFTLNAPIIPGKLAARFAGSYESLGGYAHIPEAGSDGGNSTDLKNIRSEVRWQASNDVTVDATYWHIENSQNFNNNLTPSDAPAQLKQILTGVYAAEGLGALAPIYAGLSTNLAYPIQPVGGKTIAGIDGVDAQTNTKLDLYSLDVNWQTGIGTVTSNSSYILHTLSYSAPELGYLNQFSSFGTNSFTQEVRLASSNDVPIRYLVGATYRDATINSDINFYADEKIFFLPGQKLSLANFAGPLTTHSYAGFGELSTTLFNGLVDVLGGFRYFNDDRFASGTNRVNNQSYQSSANFNSGNPRFNIKLNAAPNGIVYFNAAKGFRSGTLQTQSQVAESLAEGIPTTATVRPDHLWTFEVGTRWQFFQDTLAVEAGVYHTDWYNVQISFTNTSDFVSVVNGGDASINGVDAALRWSTPIPHLVLSANGGYLDARFVTANPLLAATTEVRTGAQLPNVPRGTYSLSANYTRDLPGLWHSVFTLDASYSFRSAQIDPASSLKSGNVNDVSLRAGLTKGPWRAEVFALNALDDSSPSLRQQFVYEIPYPRRVGARISYSF